MGGSFLAIYSTLVSQNVKEVARYYICYGYLIMGVIQYFIVLLISFNYLSFIKLYYVLLVIAIYFPLQKVFKRINDNKFSKYINILALLYGLVIIFSYID